MKYSIITVNYNNKEGLRKTIESVIHQTYRDFEYIVIDGGSTDGSTDIIREYDKQITYWVSEKDNGIYNAMNKGIKIAHGGYLNFMNSGDKYHSSTVLEDIAAMNTNDDFIIGGYYDCERNIPYVIPAQEVTLLTLLKHTINHQATFIKRSLFDKRLYDEKYIVMADAKFNFQSIIFDNCSVKLADYLVADYDFNGISSNYDIYKKERQKMLTELFPRRIMSDYNKMYTRGEVPLVTLLPDLKESPTIQRWVYKLTVFLLKFKHFMR